jgi:hypothetical protein
VVAPGAEQPRMVRRPSRPTDMRMLTEDGYDDRHVGLWNLVGAVGFTLCGALGYGSVASTKVRSCSCFTVFPLTRSSSLHLPVLRAGVGRLPVGAVHVLGRLGVSDRELRAAVGDALARGSGRGRFESGVRAARSSVAERKGVWKRGCTLEQVGSVSYVFHNAILDVGIICYMSRRCDSWHLWLFPKIRRNSDAHFVRTPHKAATTVERPLV